MIKKGKPIRAHDEVVFFPSAGAWNPDTKRWNVRISGAVFDPQDVNIRKKLMVRLLRRVMKVPSEELRGDLFKKRIEPFTANLLKGRRIQIRIGSKVFDFEKKSKRNGHFSEEVEFSQEEIDVLVEEGAVTNRVLSFQLILPAGDERVINGRVHLLTPTGNSVISDVDDTIKITSVGNRDELLKNTFLREFRAIDGMSQVYKNWSDQGIDFHFVSASPWQLITPLSSLLSSESFPLGTFDLRVFRWRDQVIKRVVSNKWVGKSKVIRSMIQRFPNRKYFLIGDSVERDPELYAHLAEEFNDQICGIFIRQVPGFALSDNRIGRIRSQINQTEFTIYDQEADLPDELFFQ